jgi:dUTP pyrophosphatase
MPASTVRLLSHSPHPAPAYQTAHAAGMDVRAWLADGPVTLPPLGRALIPTGLHVELPIGTEMQVRPRSGLALKQGLTVLNSPGTIDADYRGEVKVLLVNLSNEPQTVGDGDRIAQLVLARHETIVWEAATELSETGRGTGGYGSTGK